MNKEQTAIAKAIVQWTKLAETGGEKPELKGVESNCYLCQYAREEQERPEYWVCKHCPYNKKYGFCNKIGRPFWKWDKAGTPTNKRIHAAAFLEQVKSLQEKPMDKKEIAQEIKATEDKLATLRQKLEKPANPVLRHGDVITWEGEKEKTIIWGNSGKTPHDLKQWDIKGLELGVAQSKCESKYTYYCNFTDDLAEIKPCDGFEMDDLEVTLDEDGDWRLKQGDDIILINPDERHDFILQLRGMDMELKMQQDK